MLLGCVFETYNLRFAADRRLVLHTSLTYWNMFLIMVVLGYLGTYKLMGLDGNGQFLEMLPIVIH